MTLEQLSFDRLFFVSAVTSLRIGPQHVRMLRRNIVEVAGSNLDPKTGYLDLRFSWFYLVSPGKCVYSTLN